MLWGRQGDTSFSRLEQRRVATLMCRAITVYTYSTHFSVALGICWHWPTSTFSVLFSSSPHARRATATCWQPSPCIKGAGQRQRAEHRIESVRRGVVIAKALSDRPACAIVVF